MVISWDFFSGTPLPPPIVRQLDLLFRTLLPEFSSSAGPPLELTPRTMTLAASPNIVAYNGASGPIADVVDALLLESVPSLWVSRDGGWLAFSPLCPGAAGLTGILLADLVFVFLADPLQWEIS